MVKMKSSVVVKPTAGAAKRLLPLHENGSDHQSTIIDVFTVAGAANVAVVLLSPFHTSRSKVADIKGF